MKIPQVIFFLITFVTTIHALALPAAFDSIKESTQELWKRRGGGGGRGGSSGGRISSGSSSSSTSSGRSPLARPNSNTGGKTPSGSGIQPQSYRGGNYYAGGAAAPYRAGNARGVAPFAVGAGAVAFLPGLWLFGAYGYHYPGPYLYHNRTSGQNESHPVNCYCGKYQECSCDPKNETDYMNSIANNQSIARLANIDGKQTLAINGTLPNGTTVASAAGPGLKQNLLQTSGLWFIVAGVVYTVCFF